MGGFDGARLLVLAIGLLLAMGGLASVAVGGASTAAGVWGVLVGLVLIVAAIVERARYRSDEADRTAAPPGPGGGEPTGPALEPRFLPTDERFEDPTSRRRMRVWLDPRSGERRYVAED